MEDVPLTHAKEHLEELIARASGEDVQIADPRRGTLKLQPAERQHPRLTALGVEVIW